MKGGHALPGLSALAAVAGGRRSASSRADLDDRLMDRLDSIESAVKDVGKSANPSGGAMSQLMPLVAPDKELASLVKECHEIAGRCGYVLIGFHAASALAHHFIRRDDTLLRMLPLRTRAGS